MYRPSSNSLQKPVVDTGMRLLELVQEQHSERMALQPGRELAALVPRTLSERPTEQGPRIVGVLVVGHVHADQPVPAAEQVLGQQLGGVCLSDTRGGRRTEMPRMDAGDQPARP